MNSLSVHLILLRLEISKNVEKIIWLSNHLIKCKRDKDKVKLKAMIVANVIAVTSLTKELISGAEKLKELLFKM